MKVTHIYGPMNESNRYIYGPIHESNTHIYGTMKGICVLGIYSFQMSIYRVLFKLTLCWVTHILPCTIILSSYSTIGQFIFQRHTMKPRNL